MRRAVAGLLFLTLACARPRSAHEPLLEDLRSYHEGVRWKRYEIAAAYVPPPEREPFLDRREELDRDLALDDYEILRVKTGKDRATVQVRYTWHLDSVGVVHETVAEQGWEKRGKIWVIVAETRKRGEPMPGLEDAAAEQRDADAGLP